MNPTDNALQPTITPPKLMNTTYSTCPASSSIRQSAAFQTIVLGGTVAGVLDATDGVLAYGFLGLNPIQVLQFIASGAFGADAFKGGLAMAGAGAFFHFLIAFVVAAIFYLGTTIIPQLTRRYASSGLAFGAAVFLVMNYLVLPFSAVAPAAFSLPLFLNGIIGHALFVGLPIAWFANRSAQN